MDRAIQTYSLCGSGSCSGGGGSLPTCTVTANNPHLSTSVPGAASADGVTSCGANVAVIKSQTALYRLFNGSWNAVGDQDFVLHTATAQRQITGTSKENPCRAAGAYQTASYGYASANNTVIINGTQFNQAVGPIC